MIIFLFGPSGSGKTYIGNMIASNYKDFYFLEGDDLLTAEMLETIKKDEIFSSQMVEEYVQILINEILHLCKIHKNIVVAQGLYRQKYRLDILHQIPEIIFVQVNRDKRNSVAVSQSYANKILPFFQPMPEALQLDNNSQDSKVLMEFLRRNFALET